MTNYVLRPLEVDDFAAFVDIQRHALVHAPELFGSDYEWFENLSILLKEQRFELFVNFPYQFILGAVQPDGEIAAMVGFSCEYARSKVRHKGRLWGLYVRPEFRHRGLATELVRTIIGSAQDVVGCELIHLSVSKHNDASFALYLRLGFSVYGTELHAMKIDNTYVDEYLMHKMLL
ncbi:MAG: GNAT family protein [bacterium]|nr:GNAT family protein [bacterium]